MEAVDGVRRVDLDDALHVRGRRVDLAGATGTTLSTHLRRLGDDDALDLNTLNNWLTIMFASAVECGRVDLVDELLKIGFAHPAAGSADGRARVLSRWGEACIQGGAAGRFLDAIGREPAGWEDRLSPYAAVELTSTRSGALQVEGDAQRALAMAERALELAPPGDMRRTLADNVAILARAAGAPDQAVLVLRELAREPGPDAAHLAAALTDAEAAAGHLDEALAVALNALAASPDGDAESDGVLRLMATNVLLLRGDPARARQVLDARTGETGRHHLVARLHLELQDGAPRRVVEPLLAELDRRIATADQERNAVIGLQLRRNRLTFLDGAGSARAAVARAELREYERGLGALSCHTVLGLAAERYEAHDPVGARAALREFPEAAANLVGGVQDVALLGPEPALSAPRRRLVDALLDGTPTAWELRALSELSRNVVTRTQAVEHSDAAWFERVASDATLAGFAQRSGPLVILEWLLPELPLITVIRPDGGSGSLGAKPPEAELPRLAARMRRQLDQWIRTGSTPFDAPDWMEVERWFADAIGRAVALACDGGADVGSPATAHVIVFDTPEHQGLPWHAADVPFTISYAAGWEDLAGLLGGDAPRTPHAIGGVFVSAAGDAPEIRRPFAASADAVRALADDLGLPHRVVEGGDADRDAVAAVLVEVDVCCLGCHGIVDRDRFDVAWLLASNGALPQRVRWDPAGLMTWRDLLRMPRLPALVASAGCSSGLGFRSSYGDHVGLYSAARTRGSRALIAPQWEAAATHVMPALDACVRHHVAGGSTLAEALRTAVRERASEPEGWRARALAITGDWR